VEYIKKHIRSAALSAATVIVVLQATVLPSLFDLVTDVVLLGIMYVLTKIEK
jgi:hypothetical protein